MFWNIIRFAWFCKLTFWYKKIINEYIILIVSPYQEYNYNHTNKASHDNTVTWLGFIYVHVRASNYDNGQETAPQYMSSPKMILIYAAISESSRQYMIIQLGFHWQNSIDSIMQFPKCPKLWLNTNVHIPNDKILHQTHDSWLQWFATGRLWLHRYGVRQILSSKAGWWLVKLCLFSSPMMTTGM